MSAAQRRLLGPAILILLALVPVWRAVLLGETIGPVEHIRAMLDPSAPKPTTPWNVLQADSLLQFRVWRGLVFDGWRQGAIPTWNPYSLLGTPLLANSQSGALYPFHILAGMLRLDLDRAIGLLAWLHLSLAGIGAFRLCRALGTDRVSALFGGSAFMLSAFLLAWTPLASVPTTVAWIPWALYWIARRDLGWRSVAWLSVCLAMMLLAGHLQFAAYGLIGAFAFVLAQGAWRALPAFALAGALAAAHLLPTLDFGQYSHRRTPPTAEGYAAYSKSALQPWQLGILAAPDAYGLPQKDGVRAGNTQLSAYWPASVKIGENFAEASIGLSPVVFVLLGAVPWRRREAWSIGLVGAVGLLLAMPTALSQALYFTAPGWGATGSPGRAAVLFVLGGSVLGALGLARLRAAREHPETRTLGDVTIIAMALLAVVLTFGLSMLVPPNAIGLDPDQFAIGKSSLIVAMVPALGLVLALLLLISRRVPPRLGVLVAALPALHALVTYAPGLVPMGVMPSLPSGTPLTRVAVVNDRWNFFATPRAIMPPNLLAAARIVDTGGYDSLVDRETKEILDRVNGTDSPPPENGNMMFVRSTADLDELRSLGVSELWSRSPIGGLQILGEENGVVRQRVGGSLLRIAIDGREETAPTFRLLPNGIDGPAGSPRRVSARWRNLPGWTLDGRPLEEGPFLGGTTTGPGAAEFRYAPPGLRLGLIVSGAALLALGALFAVSGRPKNAPASA